MKAYLTRRYMFSASHRLNNDALSPEENLRLYGKCNNPYGHGHNYMLEVTVGGGVDSRTGMVCDLLALDQVVTREVLDRFDHVNLNCLPDFRNSVPTTENLCVRIFEILEEKFTAARLEKIRIEETALNAFEYAGGGELRH